MTFFIILFAIVVLQRLGEVVYARYNEKQMKEKGAVELGSSHYKWIVLLHAFFLMSVLIEVMIRGGFLGEGWEIFLLIYFVAQILRIWTLVSLGSFWNTKIIVLPGTSRIKKGPFRWISHPNYVVVMLEIAAFPLLFGAWITALVFTILNGLLLLLVRIPMETKALNSYTK
ncbi:hypothetical protein D7Z54_24780 [Salibacterium salarium]|uniref:15-methylpalmitoyl-4-hydroxy-2-pyrone 4-O-methyltransferase n=1 Tax=Salibacterium salarium TaxID=284579 RepID=A0A428MX90_9BACI|nr:isoprenylcysteine carboxylmethyltransferase family protein [Salibacterium salarium]RSL30716.1 hypothetical protein D7Z54_24780 [Salibacterium salarium]